MRISVDESGNTGLDLLNEEQPLFCLASTILDDDTAWSLIQPLLRQGQVEAKYSSLKRSNSGKAALQDFFSSDRLGQDVVSFELVDKKFNICAQIVDKLIEPATHDAGIDLYDKGLNIWTANLFFYTGKYSFGDELWLRFQRSFLNALRNNDAPSYAELESALTSCCESVRDGHESNANLLGLARGRCSEFLSVFTNRASFDPASDLFVRLVQHWMRRDSGQFSVFHDSSKPMARMEEHLRLLMTPVAPRTVGQGDRLAEFPLRVQDLRFVDSRDHPAVQIADLYAGAAADCFIAMSPIGTATDFHKSIAGYFDEIFSGGILASPIEDLGLNDELTLGGSVLDGVNDFLVEARAAQD